jgi:hypothetical protein
MAALSVFLTAASAADQDPGRNLDCDNPEDDGGDPQCYGCLVTRLQLRSTSTI